MWTFVRFLSIDPSTGCFFRPIDYGWVAIRIAWDPGDFGGITKKVQAVNELLRFLEGVIPRDALIQGQIARKTHGFIVFSPIDITIMVTAPCDEC